MPRTSHSTPYAIPHVVLVRPQEEGNVGSVARAMANMGLSELVIVDPGAPIGDTARAFGVGAHEVLNPEDEIGRRLALSLAHPGVRGQKVGECLRVRVLPFDA